MSACDVSCVCDVTHRYVGRSCSASPAAGSKTSHQRELETLLSDAFADQTHVTSRMCVTWV